jgi:hypothetical protein
MYLFLTMKKYKIHNLSMHRTFTSVHVDPDHLCRNRSVCYTGIRIVSMKLETQRYHLKLTGHL